MSSKIVLRVPVKLTFVASQIEALNRSINRAITGDSDANVVSEGGEIVAKHAPDVDARLKQIQSHASMSRIAEVVVEVDPTTGEWTFGGVR